MNDTSYYVIVGNQNSVTAFGRFHDAWLHAFLLESPVPVRIVSADGSWLVEPKKAN